MSDLDRYTCAHCEREFASDRSDAAARAEFEREWGRPVSPDDTVICADCKRRFDQWLSEQPPRK